MHKINIACFKCININENKATSILDMYSKCISRECAAIRYSVFLLDASATIVSRCFCDVSDVSNYLNVSTDVSATICYFGRCPCGGVLLLLLFVVCCCCLVFPLLLML